MELIGFLRDRRPDVRKAAADAVLGLTGTPDGIRLLVEAGTVDTLCTMIGGEEVCVLCVCCVCAECVCCVCCVLSVCALYVCCVCMLWV